MDETREKQRAAQRAWYLRNKEKVAERGRQWKEENKEQAQEYQRQWYLKNKARVLELQKVRHGEKREVIRAWQKEWSARNPEKRRAYRNKYLYGITLEQIEEMARLQGGRCAICADAPDKLVVDHCHATGAVRGLLCKTCNVGLGLLGDDVEALRSAIAYLERHAATAE